MLPRATSAEPSATSSIIELVAGTTLVATIRTITHAQDQRGSEATAPQRAGAAQALMQQLQRGDWQPGLFRQLLGQSFGQAIPDHRADETADEHRRRIEKSAGEDGHEGP